MELGNISFDRLSLPPSPGSGHRAERPVLVPARQAGGSQCRMALPVQTGLAPNAVPRPVPQLAGVLQRCDSGENVMAHDAASAHTHTQTQGSLTH